MGCWIKSDSSLLALYGSAIPFIIGIFASVVQTVHAAENGDADRSMRAANVVEVPGINSSGLNGVFDAGWTTAYQSQDSITHMHKRLYALGMNEIVLQYAAVEAMHLYYPSQLDFLQNTQYKNNQLFPKSIEAAKIAGTRIWLGIYYNGENWYTPPTAAQLDSLSARNLRVLNEIYSLYGGEAVVAGFYIPQEIARYYWDGLRNDATPEMLVEHFLKPVTEMARSKGWKVMAAPFYNQNLESPEKLQFFFERLFAAGFKPDVIAVQDGVGASDAGKSHAEIATVENYERAVSKICSQYGIEFWVDLELFRTDDSHTFADSARISKQLDKARAAGAVKVIGYDLAVLGNAGLDSLEKWKLQAEKNSTQSVSTFKKRDELQRCSARNCSSTLSDKLQKKAKYYRLNGARVNYDQ